MTVYNVRDTPDMISGVFTRPYIVKNSGAAVIYLGQDSSLTVETRAFSLPSGSTLNWSGSTELWAVTDTDKLGELEVLYTGENSFSPGPSTVTAKSSNAPVLLARVPITITGLEGGFPIPPIYVENYASVIMAIEFNDALFTLPRIQNYFNVSSAQGDSSGSVSATMQAHEAQFLMLPNHNGSSGYRYACQVQEPVRNSWLYAYVQYSRRIEPFHVATAYLSIYGSSEVIGESKYVHAPRNLYEDLSTIALNGAFSLAPSPYNTTSYYLSSRNLDTTIHINRNAGAFALGLIRAAYSGTTLQLATISTNSLPLFADVEAHIKLPSLPLIFITQNDGTSNSVVSLTQ